MSGGSWAAHDHAPQSCLTPLQGSKKLPVVKLVDGLEASWDYVANEGTTFTLQTNYKAPRCRCGCSAAAVAVAIADVQLGQPDAGGRLGRNLPRLALASSTD